MNRPAPLAFLLLAATACEPAARNTYAPPPPPAVQAAQPLSRTIPEALELSGTTRALQAVEVRARVRGTITAKHVQGGERVEAGAPLFTIDRRPFEAAAERARATLEQRRVALRLAELEVSRADELFQRGTTTRRDLDQRLADRDAQRAALGLAEADLRLTELDLEWSLVRAPIAGRVGVLTPEIGQLVGANEATLLCTLVDDSQVYATYSVDEGTLLRLRRAHQGPQQGEKGLVVRLGLMDEPGFPHAGRFERSDNRINPDTGTITVEALFDNRDGLLLPGHFVRLRAELGRLDALLVPDQAVLQDQRGRYVLALGPDDTVQRQDVEPGPVVGRLRAVRGLDPQQWVVIDGLQRARPGAKVAPRREPLPAAFLGESASDVSPVGSR